MGKPRRPRGPRSTWEPKPPAVMTPPPMAEIVAETAVETAVALPPEITPEISPAVLEQAVLGQAPAQSDADAEAPAPDLPSADDAADDAARAEPRDAPAAAAVAPDVPAASPAAALSPVQAAALAPEIAFAPERFDALEIGTTIARYMRGEGEAAMAHLRALSGARSPAEIIRLQVGEAQRAADASLTCWVTVVGKASRVVAFR